DALPVFGRQSAGDGVLAACVQRGRIPGHGDVAHVLAHLHRYLIGQQPAEVFTGSNPLGDPGIGHAPDGTACAMGIPVRLVPAIAPPLRVFSGRITQLGLPVLTDGDRQPDIGRIGRTAVPSVAHVDV